MHRALYLEKIRNQLRVHTACAILGPRQVGKTTLSKMFSEESDFEDIRRFDLENPIDLAKLETPLLALAKPEAGLIIIDEIQRRPDLFPILRFLIDENKKRKFLILGSASRELIHQSSESLAGRIGFVELAPFSIQETNRNELLWIRGGFPSSFLSSNDEDSLLWRNAYITTFLERDLAALGFQIPPYQMRRFWSMLTHYHGQLFNGSEIARTLAISEHTVRRYLDILAGTFMIRILPPWFENIGKRQVKSPKIYFRDSGILHAFMGIENERNLDLHPRCGSLWEGFAIEEICKQMNIGSEDCYFWRTQAGAELDLLIVKGGKKIGFEIKYTDNPKITLSMKIALQDLKLDYLYIIYPGKESFPLSENITVHGLYSGHSDENLLTLLRK